MMPAEVHQPTTLISSSESEQETAAYSHIVEMAPRRGSGPKDSTVNVLPELAEEDVDNNNTNSKEFRPRAGSAGIKGLLSSFKKSRHKSGDTQPPNTDSASSAALANGDVGGEKSNKGGLKAFFRPRSQSDATSTRNNMSRHRHMSTGSPQAKIAAAHADAINNNHAPVQRSRSSSFGAQEKLARSKQMRISGGNGVTSQATAMSQLISAGSVPVNRKVERGPPLSSSFDSRFTGKAFMWNRTLSIDESSRRWKTADRMETEFEDLVIGDPEIFNKFMRAHKCCDVMPQSAKLVVFDTQLSVKKAFYALVYNSVRAAPLWDSASQEFIGMLTISDFIYVLTKYYKTPKATITELEEHRISTWRSSLSDKYNNFISIYPDASLHDAVATLLHTKVHRLPIIDPLTGNAIYILTHKRVLKYLFMRRLPSPPYMSQSIEELKLGTMTNIVTVTMDTRLIDALNMFVERRVSALPVLNAQDQVENIYAKFDVINLAADKSYNDLEVPISHAISMRRTPTEGVHSCRRTDSLQDVVEKFVSTEVHRLIIVDEDNRLDGIISLSDVLSYLIRKDRHSSDSFSNISCSEDVFENNSNRTSSGSEDVSMSLSDLVIQQPSLASCNDKMDVFPSGPVAAI